MNHDTDTQGGTRTEDYAASAKATARDAMHDTKEHLSDAYDHARDTAAEATDTIAKAMLDLMDRRRSDLAAGLVGVSEALYRASQETEEQEVPRRFVEMTADTFGSLADIVDERSSRDMVRALTDFGRANPATFVMTSLIAGFAAGRLLTAEDPARRDADQRDDAMHGQAGEVPAFLKDRPDHSRDMNRDNFGTQPEAEVNTGFSTETTSGTAPYGKTMED